MTEERTPYLTDEQTQAAYHLMLSPTMQRLCALAEGFEMDPTDPANIKTMLTTTAMDVIRGLDHDRIHFDNPHDKAMLYGLLAVVMEIVMDGKFAKGVTWHTARMQ